MEGGFLGNLEIPKFILDATNFFMKIIKFPVEWSGSRLNCIPLDARTIEEQIAHAGEPAWAKTQKS